MTWCYVRPFAVGVAVVAVGVPLARRAVELLPARRQARAVPA
ncbi:hypothetical protein J2803_003848 [Paraburkholderia phenoliruptrix]|nr:hypothetical protein [Paraburkholderia phenoliruptrix]